MLARQAQDARAAVDQHALDDAVLGRPVGAVVQRHRAVLDAVQAEQPAVGAVDGEAARLLDLVLVRVAHGPSIGLASSTVMRSAVAHVAWAQNPLATALSISFSSAGPLPAKARS